MINLALTSGGDIQFAGGQLVTVEDPALSLVQKLTVRLNSEVGEWFLDTSLGVAYRKFVLVKNPNIAKIRSVVREAIDATDGVASVTTISVVHSRESRSLSVSFSVITTDGAEIRVNAESAKESGSFESLLYLTLTSPPVLL